MGAVFIDMEAAVGATPARTSGLTPDELCHLYSGKVCRFAALVAGSPPEAEDLAQEALLRAVRMLASYDPGRGTPEAWLWRIVANAAKDSTHRSRRAQELLARLWFSAEPESVSVEDAVLSRLRDADLHDHLRRLGHRDRTLLALRYGVGLETSEVGAAVGLSPESAGKAIRRALARLRARLEVTGS